MMQALATNAAFWLLLIVVLCAVYLLPTMIGLARQVDRLALVFLVNLIGGTTGVGWVAALILAFGPRRLGPDPVTASWPPPGGPHVPWPPHSPAEARHVIVMRADSAEPDQFGCAKLGSQAPGAKPGLQARQRCPRGLGTRYSLWTPGA